MGPADDYITEGSALSQKVPPLRDWQAIVDRHGRLVWQTAYRLLGNRADAADCFQEAFVSALAVSRREEVRDWSALLQRLATARALDRLRQRLRRGRRSDEVADWGAMLSPNPSPEESVEAAELRGKLRWAVAELSKAADLLQEVVDLWPGLNWAWFWLGRAQYELGEYDAAIEALSRVLDMFADGRVVPHYCYLARALAYRGKGMAEEGRKDLGKALPTMIGALRNIEGATMFDYADDPLYRDHGDRRPSPEQSLTRMIERLRQVTGQNFGYDPVATPEQKQQAISAWENWWKEHAADYGVSEP